MDIKKLGTVLSVLQLISDLGHPEADDCLLPFKFLP